MVGSAEEFLERALMTLQMHSGQPHTHSTFHIPVCIAFAAFIMFIHFSRWVGSLC